MQFLASIIKAQISTVQELIIATKSLNFVLKLQVENFPCPISAHLLPGFVHSGSAQLVSCSIYSLLWLEIVHSLLA